jgi:hypothetical protein
LILLGAGALFVIFLTVVALLLETNPPVVNEPKWDSPQTAALVRRACYDCHSNETVYPWYDKLPVGSWITVFDVVRGRRELNFSNWTGTRRVERITRSIQEGEMPPGIYLILHPQANLTDAEKQQLITGLQNSLK